MTCVISFGAGTGFATYGCYFDGLRYQNRSFVRNPSHLFEAGIAGARSVCLEGVKKNLVDFFVCQLSVVFDRMPLLVASSLVFQGYSNHKYNHIEIK